MTRPPVSTDQAMGEREAGRTTGLGKGRLVENSLLQASLVTADLFGGVAEAVGQGLRSFRSELTAENIARVDFSNGWLAGMVAANVRFFEEMAKNARRFQEDLLHAQVDGGTQREDIDYERLARLVAVEIQRMQGATPRAEGQPPKK